MTVYLIHAERRLHHAQHYLGSTNDLQARIAQHRAGTGAKLLAAFNQAGIAWSVVRLWPGGYAQEKALKRRNNGRDLCPVCNPPRLRAPIPPSERHFDKLDYCSLKRHYQVVRYWRLWMAVKLASNLISRKETSDEQGRIDTREIDSPPHSHAYRPVESGYAGH